MKNWLSRSIGRKMLASFAGIFFVTYLLTAAVVFTSVRTAMNEAEAAALARLADQKVELAANQLQALATNLHAWSHLEVMNDLVSGDVDKRVARTLASLKAQYGLAGDAYAFDAQDRLVAASANAGAGLVLPQVWRPRGEEPVLIDVHSDPVTKGRVVALSVAIRASFAPGFQLGSLVVTIPWQAIESMLAAGGQPVVLYKEAPPTLLFAAGAALDEAALARLAQRPAQLEAGGVRYVAGHAAAASGLPAGWRVAALKDARVAEQPIRAVAIKLVLLGLVLALPIMLAVRWLSRRLTEPVQSLTSVVSQISSGDLSARALVSGADELGTLAVSFNDMAGKLQRISHERERALAELGVLNKTLEQRVSERTAALEEANRELSGALANLKETQGQLVQSEKMASLGQLVAGVAHELNNPIGFIYANFPHLEEYIGELLALIDVLREVPADPVQRAAIDERIKAIDLDFIKDDTVKIIRSGKSGAARIKEIVRSLRSFSRLDEAELKSVRLEDGIDDTLALLHHLVKNRITVSKDYRLAEPVVCYAGQINQVFMNIIYNALQAMEGPGTLHIATWRDGERACVSIADSGKGIPPDVIGHIFDPFFTTKKVGEGTGLGLSISYGIVEKHGGRIDVRSGPGKGATFTVSIRLRPPNDQPIQQEPQSHDG